MADEKQTEYSTDVVNLTLHPMSVKVVSDKQTVSESLKKQFEELSTRIKKAGGGEIKIGVPEVGDIGVKGDGSSETDKTHKLLQKTYSKFINDLQAAGFATILPSSTLPFTTQQHIKYITILWNGTTLCTDYNTTSKEVIVDNGGKLICNDEPSAAKHYKKGDIFSHAYQIGMEATMNKLKKLYEFVRDTKIDNKPILEPEIVKNIGQCGLDFSGTNFAVTDVLRIVSKNWFNTSVKRLYDAGIEIENMDPDNVMILLKEISEQAQEISEQWLVIMNWYCELKLEIEKIKREIVQDDTEAKAELEQLQKKQKGLEEALKNYFPGPVSFVLDWYIFDIMQPQNIAVGNILRAIKTSLSEANKKLLNKTQTQQKLHNTLQQVIELSSSLDGMVEFSSKMMKYFKSQSENFKSWGEMRADEADALEEKWQSWKSEDIINWFVTIKNGKFAQYKDKLSNDFTYDSEDLPSVNKLILKKDFGFSKLDAIALEMEIKALTKRREVKYRFVKSEFDRNLKWIDEQSKNIESVSKLVSSLTIDNIFKDKDAVPTKRKCVVFKTFGKEIKVDPFYFANTIILGK
eukprot:288386_1